MKNTNAYTLSSYKMARKLTSEAKSHSVALERLVNLLIEQRGRCAICERLLVELAVTDVVEIEIGVLAPSNSPAKPCVDYCPVTGVIRGLVCKQCLKLVTGETTPFGLVSKHDPKAQRKSLRLMDYFSSKPTDHNLISGKWDPDPAMRG